MIMMMIIVDRWKRQWAPQSRSELCEIPSVLNAAEQEESVKAHNLFRGRELATNMLPVVSS